MARDKNLFSENLKRYFENAPFQKTVALTVLLLFLSPLAHSQTLIPLSGGMLMTAQFVNNSSYPDSQVYILVTGINSSGQLSHLDLNGNMVPNVAGQNASSYSFSLATIAAHSPAGMQFPPVMTSSRLWISYGSPMNMPIAGGGGLVQPNL